MTVNPRSIVVYRKELPSNRLKPLNFRVVLAKRHNRRSLSKMVPPVVFLVSMVFLSLTRPLQATEDAADISVCLATMGTKAEARGVPKAQLEQTLAAIEPVPRVLELERRQPEFTLTFGRYLDRLVTEQRVQQGRALLEKHGKLLRGIGSRYGVQPRFLVAFWGLETNFGGNLGSFQTLDALATLACQGRRR